MIRDNLPEAAAEMELTAALMEIEQEYVDALDARMGQVRRMAIVKEAGEEGLTHWERALGFPTAGGWSGERRRERIRARLMVEAPMSPAIFKSMVENAAETEVEIEEDTAGYTVVIRFTGMYGVSPYLSDLEREIEKVIPAHLRVVYEWIYYLQKKLESHTHGGLGTLTHEEIRNGGTESGNDN